MEPVSSLQFAAAARALAQACRRTGVPVPGFRSPPGLDGVDRSLRRRPDGGAVVAVRLGARPFVAVLADMVEGTVAASGLEGARAHRCRAALWEAVAPAVGTDVAEAGARRAGATVATAPATPRVA